MRFFAFSAFAAAALVFAAPAAAVFAQPPAAVPADVQKTLTDISDLSLLRALLPVKLEAAQIDKILPVLQTVRSEGATRQKTNETALRALSTEVSKARAAAMGQNTPVPPDTEAKIVKVFDEADKRFVDAKKSAIDRITPVLQVNLTSDQRTTIKTYVEDKMLGGKKFSPKAKPDAVETAALDIWVERILLDERSIAVLTGLRAALAVPASKTPDAAPPAAAPAAKP